MSIDGNSYNDLIIGEKYETLGSNSKRLGTFVSGDRVIILANDHGGNKYFIVAEITERVSNCTIWADAGGHIWDHNFRYKALLPKTVLTPEIDSLIGESCVRNCLKYKNFFHSRFCSEKLNIVLHDLLKSFSPHKN